jgi:hypothetical protein
VQVKDELQTKEILIGSLLVTSDGSKYIVLEHTADILKWCECKVINVTKLDKPFA